MNLLVILVFFIRLYLIAKEVAREIIKMVAQVVAQVVAKKVAKDDLKVNGSGWKFQNANDYEQLRFFLLLVLVLVNYFYLFPLQLV